MKNWGSSLSNQSKAQALAKEINKLLGEDVVKMGSDPSLAVQYIPTGVLPIDYLLDGGFPRNRFTEVFGDYSTLKSYIGLCAIAQVQSSGGVAGLVDTESAFDPEWARTLGVDTTSLIYQSPETGELAVDTTEALLRSGVDLIVWDSVAATLTETERGKRESGEAHQPARLAAFMSRATRKLNAANRRSALVWINQTRLSIGRTWGNPETTPGGKSLPFFASYRLALRKASKITRDAKTWDGSKNRATKEVIGQQIRASLEKSKLSAPHKDTYFNFDLESGEIDEVGWLITWGLESGDVIRQGKSWHVKGSKKKVVGAANFKEWLEGEDDTWRVRLRLRCLGSVERRKSMDENEKETSSKT